MSDSQNNLSVIVTESAPMVWQTKSGKGMSAASATLQALAPLAVRKADATDRDLQSLRNGRYDRVLSDIKENLNAKDIKALFMLGVGTPPAGSGKEAAVAFLRAVGAIWGTTKGKRGALADTINRFVKECDAVSA